MKHFKKILITLLIGSLPVLALAKYDYDKPAFDDEGYERFLNKQVPEAREFIDRFEDTEFSGYVEEFLEEAPGMYMEYLEVKKYDAKAADDVIKAYRLEIQTWLLTGDYYEAESEADKRRIKRGLREKLEEAFELKIELEELEVAYLEREIKEVRELIKKRKEAREKIIDKRLNMLLSEEEDDIYAW